MAQYPANIDLSSLDGSNGFKLSGAEVFDLSGWSVAGAGDVNGDGFADLIVGAPSADPHGISSGAQREAIAAVEARQVEIRGKSRGLAEHHVARDNAVTPLASSRVCRQRVVVATA